MVIIMFIYQSFKAPEEKKPAQNQTAIENQAIEIYTRGIGFQNNANKLARAHQGKPTVNLTKDEVTTLKTLFADYDYTIKDSYSQSEFHNLLVTMYSIAKDDLTASKEKNNLLTTKNNFITTNADTQINNANRMFEAFGGNTASSSNTTSSPIDKTAQTCIDNITKLENSIESMFKENHNGLATSYVDQYTDLVNADGVNEQIVYKQKQNLLTQATTAFNEKHNELLETLAKLNNLIAKNPTNTNLKQEYVNLLNSIQTLYSNICSARLALFIPTKNSFNNPSLDILINIGKKRLELLSLMSEYTAGNPIIAECTTAAKKANKLRTNQIYSQEFKESEKYAQLISQKTKEITEFVRANKYDENGQELNLVGEQEASYNRGYTDIHSKHNDIINAAEEEYILNRNK